MVGIENIKKIAMFGVEAVNVGLKMLSGGGLLSLISLVDEVNAVKGIQKEELLQEAKDLSKEERAELIEDIKKKLDLDKKDLELKIEQGLDLINEVVEVGYGAVHLAEHSIEIAHKAEQIIRGMKSHE